MEFLRFGSSIPGTYWGCCCMDIIQNFKVSPSAPYAIQLVSGDSGTPVGGENSFIGETYKDVFLQRLRIGTFNDREMSNHGFLAVLTDTQIRSGIGKEWLTILRENGFEFIRSIDNSVYTGNTISENGKGSGSHLNHLFGLFRNINIHMVNDPFTPPDVWSALPKVVPEASDFLTPNHKMELKKEQYNFHKKWWKDGIGTLKKMSRKALEDKGIPVHLAGLRSTNPQEPAKTRDLRTAKQTEKKGVVNNALSAFAAIATPASE